MVKHMTKRENALAILNGRQPDFYGDFMDTLEFVPDPMFQRDNTPNNAQLHKDSWGVEFFWEPGAPGPHPVVSDDNLVIKDIENWQSQLVVPDLSQFDWSQTEAAAAAVNRDESFVACFCPGGLFERSHHLMGFQNALENYIIYEDEVAELLRVIADFKIELINLVGKHMKPDVIFFHDDWGHKKNLFLPPALWRRLIKPLHTEIVQAAHDNNILFMHHADCYCQPIVEDMLEMGIDIWQGAIPQNDIVEIQRITGGKLPMIGGIDGPKIDVESITEDEIRAEVRRAIDTYCPAGRFFPSIANGRCFIEWNNEIYRDELEKYGKQWAIEHPIA